MEYLNEEEYDNLGFYAVENFNDLNKRSKIAIDLYTQDFYNRGVDFETDFEFRKNAVKLAMAFQIAYLNDSGLMSADEKQTISSISIGRTSISYAQSSNISSGQQFNLCLDAENILKQAGFSLITGVNYDR